MVINIAKPNKTILRKVFKNYKEYNNLLELKFSSVPPFGLKFKNLLLDFILNKPFNIECLRQHLYDILVYNISIFELTNFLLEELTSLNKININNILKTYINTYRFLKLYNNNYRSIFHLEKYVVTLIQIINE